MDIRAGLLGKTNNIEMTQLADALANDSGVIGPYWATKTPRQGQQVSGIKSGSGVVESTWHGGIPE
ncbi:hypothetical protein D3C75_1240300 [compost metagenome]